MRAVFFGGSYHGYQGDLTRTPEVIYLGSAGGRNVRYDRVDDPDTGKFLGGYAWVDPEATTTAWTGSGLPASAAGEVRHRG